MTTPSNRSTSFSDSAGGREAKPFTRHIVTVARVLMGLAFFVFGLNAFLNFIPPPPMQLPPGATAFSEALMKTGYMMQLIGATQLVVGALLLINRFVPLALVLLAPFLVNSLLFHLVLEHSGIPMASVFVAIELYLAWAYRDSYRVVLSARANPT